MTLQTIEEKWTVCDGNLEPFYKCGCFVSWIWLLNMSQSNMKNLEKHILSKKF